MALGVRVLNKVHTGPQGTSSGVYFFVLRARSNELEDGIRVLGQRFGCEEVQQALGCGVDGTADSDVAESFGAINVFYGNLVHDL